MQAPRRAHGHRARPHVGPTVAATATGAARGAPAPPTGREDRQAVATRHVHRVFAAQRDGARLRAGAASEREEVLPAGPGAAAAQTERLERPPLAEDADDERLG